MVTRRSATATSSAAGFTLVAAKASGSLMSRVWTALDDAFDVQRPDTRVCAAAYDPDPGTS
ncbi:hypothetical protein DF19_21090 [Streptomyces olindensis]|nr:hypothetical protein DF19_21090 [Streptomyces olindensis]